MDKECDERIITLAAVGDVMLTREVGQKVEKYGYDYPFADVRGILKNADITFGNLETPLSQRGKPMKNSDPNVTFRTPPHYVTGLVNAGFNVLSVANNHIYDYGSISLKDTIENLKAVGIMPVGAGMDQTEARRPAILTVNGLRVGFLAYHQLLGKQIRPAAKKSSGAAQLRLNRCLCDIKMLKKNKMKYKDGTLTRTRK